jgi:hypothetical protein
MCRCHRADYQDESGVIRLVQKVVQPTPKISLLKILEQIPAIVAALVRKIALASLTHQSDTKNARGDQQKKKGRTLPRREADHVR